MGIEIEIGGFLTMEINLFEQQLTKESVFINKDIISPHHIPERLPFREVQIEDITQSLSAVAHSSKPNNLLYFDFRYLGESEGRYSTAGALEKEDLLTDSEKNLMGALETAKGLLPEVRNATHPYFSSLFMILMGRSIKDGKENFDAYAVVLYNTITEFINSLWEIREKEKAKANAAPDLPE